MKRLSDLTDYKGVLPSASEIFGVYQPLLGWKSGRMQRRIDTGVRTRLGDSVARLAGAVRPDYAVSFAPADCALEVGSIGPGQLSGAPSFGGVVATQITQDLPSKKDYTPAVWKKLAGADYLGELLTAKVTPAAVALYTELCSKPALTREMERGSHGGEVEVRALLERESRTAGLVQSLAKNGRFSVLEQMFYGQVDNKIALWDLLGQVDDPFATIDPKHDLNRVGLSPLGVAHLFREYFFELDTFLGTPVGHVWLAPGATVELIEIQTRRVLTEQSFEQATETSRKSENSATQQDDLSDAVKDENRSDVKLGVNVSSNQSWGWGSAAESASFGMDNTQSHAREQTHKSMRQQSSKLSEEIKQNFKTTFKTSTETTDTQSKRYLLTNAGGELINYEMRRKMRHLAVQVQDIGSYLCWQTYVDDPGAHLGVSRLVHVGSPPDTSRIPIPEMVVPPKAFSQDVNITIPFISLDDASNDDDFDNGSETSLGFLDSTNHIEANIKQGPVRCEQSGFILASVAVDAQGADARMHVEATSISADPGTPGAYTFTVHLDHVNFGSQNSLNAKATLNWEPVVDQTAIDTENAKRLAMFTAKEQELFRQAFIDESRTRIKIASDLQPRAAEDLRGEERIVVYRRLIQDMLTPSAFVPQPDAQTQHVVAELIDSIFDVDKMLYFVSPEWWRPRLHHGHQETGGFDSYTDPVTGQPVAVPNSIPAEDTFGWGDGATREDNYYVTEESKPARLGSSLGWLLQLDGDDMRNAFLNAPWVKAVLPIRPGQERVALNWLQHVEGTNGITDTDIYEGPEPAWKGTKTVFEVLQILADGVAAKYQQGLTTTDFPDPLDDASTVRATPLDRVFETGFDPLQGGFKAGVDGNFEVFDQWIEILPTDQVVAVEVSYDPKTGRQL
ncbi:MAG: hypothetical protein DLM57_05710 [Pseudonocardiales bacterium]|nr:MAG: hypothetical protein DLM57_05710 [Pseudonocardiales bacterium]